MSQSICVLPESGPPQSFLPSSGSRRDEQFAVDHPLSKVFDGLQSALVLGSGSSIADGDKAGEDGLNNGGAP